MEKVTVEFIGSVLKMYPLDAQCDLLIQRMPFGIPPVMMLPGETDILVMNTIEKKQKGIDFKLDHLIGTSKTVGECFYHITKPNRLQVFELINNMREFTESDYNKILKNIWISTEFPHQMPIQRLVKLFKKTTPDLLMTTEEKSVYHSLPKTVTIYRGLMDTRAKVRGLSWTIDLEIAEWFEGRFKNGNGIMKAEIKKENIFMFTNDRNEKECVVNPNRLKKVSVM